MIFRIREGVVNQPLPHLTNKSNYMCYQELNEIVSAILPNEKRLKLSIGISDKIYNPRKITISKIHREITNGKSSINAITNRSFWKKYFIGGFYTQQKVDKGVEITYFINSRNELKSGIISELKARIKKVIWSEIQIEYQPDINLKELNYCGDKKITYIGEVYREIQKLRVDMAPEITESAVI